MKEDIIYLIWPWVWKKGYFIWSCYKDDMMRMDGEVFNQFCWLTWEAASDPSQHRCNHTGIHVPISSTPLHTTLTAHQFPVCKPDCTSERLLSYVQCTVVLPFDMCTLDTVSAVHCVLWPFQCTVVLWRPQSNLVKFPRDFTRSPSDHSNHVHFSQCQCQHRHNPYCLDFHSSQ